MRNRDDQGFVRMSQMSFGDAEYRGKRKQTRREKFLAEMEQVVPGTRCWC